MASIVLVPGAYHGGWYFDPILGDLEAAGHRIFPVTLSGLEQDAPPAAIKLTSHIDDVVDLIEREQLRDVLLCGHSYAGMVIAGVSDRLAGRIRTLLFIDALVPRDGESVWSMWDPDARLSFVADAADGLRTGPPPGIDSRAVGHPLATFLEPVHLSPAAYQVENKIYAWCSEQEGTPFGSTHERLSVDSAWRVQSLACGHDIMREAPELARELILSAACL